MTAAVSAPVPVLLGTYAPPDVRRGQVVECAYLGRPCRVTNWTTAPLPWPRCKSVAGGSPGLWVNADLLRAIRTESASALQHWFGVSQNTVCRWRKKFGIGRGDSPGSRSLFKAASALGLKARKRRRSKPARAAADSR
jgi:hypothetical protein